MRLHGRAAHEGDVEDVPEGLVLQLKLPVLNDTGQDGLDLQVGNAGTRAHPSPGAEWPAEEDVVQDL